MKETKTQPETILVQDYRSLLERCYRERKQKNAAYSLRGFAKFLGLSPSLLSEVMNRKAGLSRSSADRIVEKLGLNPTEADQFIALIERDHARSKKSRLQAASRLSNPVTSISLTQDAFEVISEWHHLAILELTVTRGFRSDIGWIADRLGITRIEVREAIERLKRLELIEEDFRGTLKSVGETKIATGTPSAAVRKFHRQVLEKALFALEEQDTEERDFGSMIFSINKDALPEIRKDIRNFRSSLNQRYGSTPKSSKEEVYVINTALFRLGKNPQRRSKT